MLIWLVLSCEEATKVPDTDAVDGTGVDEISVQSLRLTEIQTDNDGVIAHESGEYLDWVELYNPNEVAMSLDGWSLFVDGGMWAFPLGQSVAPQSYRMVWLDETASSLSSSTILLPINLAKSEPHRLGLHHATLVSDVIEVDVPILPSDWSYANFDSGWRVVPSTPQDPNLYWDQTIALENQLDVVANVFTSRATAKDQIEGWLDEQGYTYNLDAADGVDKGELTWRRVYDTEQDTFAQQEPSAYIRYRVEVTKSETLAETLLDTGNRARDITIKYLDVQRVLNASWFPTTRATGTDSFAYKREDNQYPCQARSESVAIQAEDVASIQLTDTAILHPYFPYVEVDFDLSPSETALRLNSDALDWVLCWDVRLESDDVSLCVRLRYDSLAAVNADETVWDAELSWRLDGEALQDGSLQLESQELFERMSQAEFVQRCE